MMRFSGVNIMSISQAEIAMGIALEKKSNVAVKIDIMNVEYLLNMVL